MVFLAAAVLVAAGVAGQLAGRRHRIPPPRVQSVGAFLTWAIIGLVGTMAILSSGTIGLLILPFAAVGAFLAARSFSIAREGIGFVAGAGFFAVAFALINLGNRPCPAQGAQNCGGADPTPWLVTGLAAVVIATAIWLLATRNPGLPTGSRRSSS
jgi:hypothetical protein